MKKREKKRCAGCLLFYPAEREVCPYCGYDERCGYAQPYEDALPLCSVVGDLRIGRAVESNRTGITYMGLDMRQNRRVLIDELFPWGYVVRGEDRSVIPMDSVYAAFVEGERAEFTKGARQTVSANRTVYRTRALGRKKIPQKQSCPDSDRIALRSIIGKRANQEDAAAFSLFDSGMMALLCDGMGGMRDGELASAECVRVMRGAAEALRRCDEGMIATLLRRRAEQADAYLASLRDMDGRRLGCGCTLLCALLRADHLYFVSVGDSHIYRIHRNRIELLTRDHHYLADLMEKVEAGEMSAEDAQNHPKREALTSYIGIGGLPKIDGSPAPILLEEGDDLLLCSDGLYRALDDEEILRIVTQHATADSAACALIRAVEEKNLPRQDNATLILCKYTGGKQT